MLIVLEFTVVRGILQTQTYRDTHMDIFWTAWSVLHYSLIQVIEFQTSPVIGSVIRIVV